MLKKQEQGKNNQWTPMSKCCREAAARGLKMCPVCKQMFMEI